MMHTLKKVYFFFGIFLASNPVSQLIIRGIINRHSDELVPFLLKMTKLGTSSHFSVSEPTLYNNISAYSSAVNAYIFDSQLF